MAETRERGRERERERRAQCRTNNGMRARRKEPPTDRRAGDAAGMQIEFLYRRRRSTRVIASFDGGFVIWSCKIPYPWRNSARARALYVARNPDELWPNSPLRKWLPTPPPPPPPPPRRRPEKRARFLGICKGKRERRASCAHTHTHTHTSQEWNGCI